MSQPMLLAQVEQAEAQLGQPLPADYRAFLLDDTNEDTEEWGFFTTPKEFLYCELDWTKDFPFSLEHPVDDSPLKEFDKRAVHAKKVEHDSNKHDALCEEAFDYMEENFLKPMERGIVYVADEGCAMYSFLVLRGEAAGQVWWCELTSCFATIEPHLHPLTNSRYRLRNGASLNHIIIASQQHASIYQICCSTTGLILWMTRKGELP